MQVALLQKVKCNNAEKTKIQMKTNVPIHTGTHAQLIKTCAHVYTISSDSPFFTVHFSLTCKF